MQNILKDLTPNNVFRFFEELTQIPRCSGSEKQVSDYLVSFAKERKLEVIQDEALNVIIKKPAAPGYEKAPTVILQGHMDMVCEKNKDTVHDFEKDPIKLRIIDDMIYATDTTLGADNGIAIAYALAILDSKDVPHPAIEALFTTDEESTMGGSSAGGTKAKVVLPINWESAKSGLTACRIRVGGLQGGHSGMEINKGRGNANKLMGRFLNEIKNEVKLYISEINGGLKSNAITRENDVVALISNEDMNKLQSKAAEWEAIFKNELRATDADVIIKVEKEAAEIQKVFSQESMDKLIACLVLLPNGIQSMSMEIEGLVESSTNLGVVQTAGDNIYLINEIRSSVRSLKKSIRSTVQLVAESLGGELRIESDYPEWEYNPNSEMRRLFQNVYKNMYGEEAEIVAIHAGLECGVLIGKMSGLDAISLGPNIFDVHTPKEHFSISSTKNVWEYLLSVLKQMNTL
ncbi:MAG: aminoacyl-histidine dipeptidase family protein [Clostridia bacterium]|nr:aminoacyl-histidine dipeptidase family protein [Clostridia bacterium]